MKEAVLQIRDLSVVFQNGKQKMEAVSEVSLQAYPGEILGIVGESGSGKSTLCYSVMQLFQGTSAKITGGEILLNGENLLDMTEKQLQSVRGGKMSMVFQEPMSSLNPVMTIERQITNALKRHQPGLGKQQYRERVIELLQMVGIPNPEERRKAWPHLLSGGMRQRVMIAMALANHPGLLLCDEPTTALDVTIQAQVLRLIRKLCKEEDSAVVFVTHNMGVIAQIADRVAVMYGGKVVEYATVNELFSNPGHPYTKGLMASIPGCMGKEKRLYSIPGTVSVRHPGDKGCGFAERCPYAKTECFREEPPVWQEDTHMVRCFVYTERKEEHAYVTGKGNQARS